MMLSIGLEIGKQYLKLALVRPGGKNTEHFDGIIEPIAQFTDEQITSKISEILRREKLKAKNAILCLSRDFITVRNLHLPSSNAQEIAQMIDLHIARVIPYKKEEIVFSHQLLGADEMGYARVFLAIVQIAVIRRQARILEKAGFFIDEINLSSYGVWQWVVKKCHSEINQKDLYIILDIDSLFSDLIIFSQKEFLFTRSISIGAVAIRQTHEAIKKLIGELKQSLVIFYNEELNRKPASIFLSGAVGVTDHAAALQVELGIPVKPVPFPYIKLGKRDIPADVSLNALAGILLEGNEKKISFILPEIQIKKSIKDKTRELIIIGSFTVYIISFLCATFMSNIYHQQAYLGRLKKNYGRLEQEMGDLLRQSKKIRFIKSYLASRRMPTLALSQLQELVPDGILVNYVAIDELQNITLRGQTLALSDAFKLIKNLETSAYFSEVQTKYTRKKKIKDQEVTDFELVFRMKK